MQLLMAGFCVFFLSTGAAYANDPSTAMPAVDPELEQRLDDMLTANMSEAEMGVQLQSILATLPADTPVMTQVRIKSYLVMSHAYEGRIDQAYELLEKVAVQAQQSRLPDAITEVAATRIFLKTQEGKLTEAYTLINTAVVPAQQATLPRVLYFAHNLIASVYTQKNQTERALEHLIYASDAVKQTSSERTPIRRIYLKLRIANIYTQQTQYQQALEQLSEAEDLVATHNLESTFSPEIQFQRAYIATDMGELNQAFEIYRDLEAEIKDQPQWASMESTVLNNLGDLAIRTERFESGIATLQQALKLAQEHNNVISEQMIRFNLGFIQVHLGNYERGLAAMQNVVETARGEWIDREFEPLLGEYAQALSMAGQHAAANQALIEQRELRSSIFNTELQKNVTELQNLYDSKDKAQQIELLEQQNDLKEQTLENERQHRLILALGVVVAVLFSIIGFFLYRSARRSNLALQDANARLADQSVRDPLTGLLNRRAMQQELKRQEKVGTPQSDAMILLDIDYFKRINDKLGHAAGDDVICEVAKRLLTVCRDNDKVIRWGGDEFLIYLSNTEQKALPRFVLRLLNSIAGTPITTKSAGDVVVTATAGFISYPFTDVEQQKVDWEASVQLVDQALYAGKVHGRNQAWGITQLNVPYTQAKDVLERDFAQAIEQGAITAITLHGPKASQ